MAEPARIIPIIDHEVEIPTIDQEVAQALALCGNDPLKALQITLIANAFLEARIDQLIAEASAGFSRGQSRKRTPKATHPRSTP